MFQQDWQQLFNSLDPSKEDYLQKALELLKQWDPSILESPNKLRAALNKIITQLDALLSNQLSAVMHHPEFKELEAGWRNLKSLASLPINFQRIKIKVLDISWREISQDLNTSNSTRSSKLYNHIGNRELNTMGGQPFGMIVVNHEVSMEMDYEDPFDDLFTLELLGQLGEISLCPFILSLQADFFGEIGADWISDIHRIDKILSGPDYTGWQRLRAQRGSRFLGLTLPHIKLREAYRNQRIGFLYDESLASNDGLTGSAAFAFASIAVREFNRISWFGFMKSRWQERYQGSLINLPPNSGIDSPLKQPKPDVQLFGNLASFYSDQGFLPVCHSPMTEKFFFYGNNSVWKPGNSDIDRVSGQLQAVLMTCRIAHYLKVQIRSMIGSFQTADECESYLSRWLDEYCSNVVDADEQTLAKYPLSRGRVTVKESNDGQGSFICEVLIKPQYQFDHFCGEMLLSTDLGQSENALAS